MINMLTVSMEKSNDLQGQMGNVCREMKSLRKNQREMQQTKNTVTEMKNAFDRLISRQRKESLSSRLCQ
jgi:prefoldin subunit 5